MPELIIPPGYAQCYLRWRITGDPEEMVSTIAVDTPVGSPPNPNDVAEAVATAWITAWPAASFSSSATFIGVSAYVGSDGAPLPGEFLVNTSGSSSSQMLPQNCCVLVSKLTGLAGRRNKGRMYLPSCYLAEAQVDNIGVIAGSALTSMQSQMNSFIGNLLGTTEVDDPYLLHSAAPVTPTLITALTVQPRIGTQRERLRK